MSLNKFKRKKNFLCLIITSCIVANPVIAQQKEQTLHNLNTLLVNTVMEDLFTPPVASRIYVYPNIAFYECIRNDDASLPSLAGKLNGLKKIPSAQKNITVDNFIATRWEWGPIRDRIRFRQRTARTSRTLATRSMAGLSTTTTGRP